MLLTLGACNSRAGTATREYALRYAGRRHPDANVFRRLEQRLRETGSVTPTALVSAGRPRTIRTPANEDAITAAVGREPWRSSRDIARESGLSQQRVLEVLHDDQLQPYHYSRSAYLFSDDRPRRMQFCEWLRNQHAADDLSLHNILWTDEACFTRQGVFKVHNSHLWARDNPHAIRERGYQVRFSVSFWAGIVWDIVVGPYLLPDRLTAQRYRDFLETVLPGLPEDVPLAVRQGLWFHQNGAPAHYGEDIRQWLKAIYPGRWIGCGGPIAWPPRSPDLTAMDFFPVGTPEGASLRSSSQGYRRSCGKTSSSCDNGRCQHVKACSRECRAAHCRLL
jgi:hypothetical protein